MLVHRNGYFETMGFIELDIDFSHIQLNETCCFPERNAQVSITRLHVVNVLLLITAVFVVFSH